MVIFHLVKMMGALIVKFIIYEMRWIMTSINFGFFGSCSKH